MLQSKVEGHLEKIHLGRRNATNPTTTSYTSLKMSSSKLCGFPSPFWHLLVGSHYLFLHLLLGSLQLGQGLQDLQDFHLRS